MSAAQKAKIAEKRKKKADLIKMHTRMYPIHLARISALEKEVDELKKKLKAAHARTDRQVDFARRSAREDWDELDMQLTRLKTKHKALKKELTMHKKGEPIHGTHRRVGEKIKDISEEVRRQKARGARISKSIKRRAARGDRADLKDWGSAEYMGRGGADNRHRMIYLDSKERETEGLLQYSELDQQLRVRQQKTMVSNYMAGKAITSASSGFAPKVAAGAPIDFTNPGLVSRQDPHSLDGDMYSTTHPRAVESGDIIYSLRHEDYRYDNDGWGRRHFHGPKPL